MCQDEFDDGISEARGIRVEVVICALADAFCDEAKYTASTHYAGVFISGKKERCKRWKIMRAEMESCPVDFVP